MLDPIAVSLRGVLECTSMYVKGSYYVKVWHCSGPGRANNVRKFIYRNLLLMLHLQFVTLAPILTDNIPAMTCTAV